MVHDDRTFVRSAAGALAIVKRPRAAGGAGQGTPFQCRSETTAWGVVLYAEGEVDIATAPLLGRAIEAGFSSGSCVVVNLARLDYLDCKGVHVALPVFRSLPEARDYIRAQGSRMP